MKYKTGCDVYRLKRSLKEGTCGKGCEESLQHMLTTHIRARYVVDKASPDTVQSIAPGTGSEHQVTVDLQHKLATLFRRYIEQKGLQRD